VLVFIRGINRNYEVYEELLDVNNIQGTTTGEDVFKGVENAVQKNNLQWKNLKCITTDGDKNMCGKNKGVVALVSKAELNLPQITPACDPDEIDRQIEQLTITINTAKELAIQIKNIPKNKRPLPPRILNLIKLKGNLFHSHLRTQDPVTRTRINRLNAQIRRDINEFRENHWTNTCKKTNNRHGKQFWDKFKLVTVQKTQSAHFLTQNGSFLTTQQEQADLFADTLQNIHTIPQNPNFNQTVFHQVMSKCPNIQRYHPPPPPITT
jgi:hypothetical protein